MTTLASSRATSARITSPVGSRAVPASSTTLQTDAPAAAFVGNWLQSFREFPPRQKPGSFNLERVMEAVTEVAPGGR